MKIRAICILKNEADVVAETIKAALSWADNIYVFDNGSEDGTWEQVQSLARDNSAVVPFAQDACTFRDGLRARVYHAYKHQAQPADWWCRLDSDEFYIDDPRVFLAKVPPRYGWVYTATFTYYFTDRDVEAYEADPTLFCSRPVQDRLRYYVNHWSEPRFFRHHPQLVWESEHEAWPANMGNPYWVRIWLRHYPYRSPPQIAQRLRSRREAIEAGTSFGHEAIRDWSSAVSNVRSTRQGFDVTGIEYADGDWRSRVVPASSFDFDSGDRRLAINELLMPSIPSTGRRSTRQRINARILGLLTR